MSVIRVGSTGKYADGWEQIFGGAGGGKSAIKKAKAKAGKTPPKKAGKKKAKSRKR